MAPRHFFLRLDAVQPLLEPMHPGRRVAPIAKYRIHPIPGTRTKPTRDPCGCVGWVQATDDLLSEGGQSLNSIFADCFGDWFIGIPFVGDDVVATSISKLH